MIVECNDCRWYIEVNWGGDAKGAKDVFNPFKRDSFPTFFASMEKAHGAPLATMCCSAGAKF